MTDNSLILRNCIIALITVACVNGRPEPQLPYPLASLSSSYGPPMLPAIPSAPSASYGVPTPAIPAPIIHKHVYVHVPPPEPYDEPIRMKPIAMLPPQKHYKIVFIKAPTAPAPTAPQIPVAPQNEEKTLVYVLVKKPDDQPDYIIPTPKPTTPSKPEVYFIRYKTQKQDGGYPASGSPIAVPSADYGQPQAPPLPVQSQQSPPPLPPNADYGVPRN